MILQLLVLAAALAIIIKGGDIFVSASIRIAELLRMPRVVIGSTLVSLATTSPELVVSIVSGLRGASDVAVGNAVGSCICNIGLVLGSMAAIRHVDVHFGSLRAPLLAMFGSGVLLFLLTFDLVISRFQGVVLIAIGVAYFAHDFRWHWRNRIPAEVEEAQEIEKELTGEMPMAATPLGATVSFVFGAALVVLGSRLLVDSAVAIAAAMGIPAIVIGLTVVAVGTSLPELVTAITSSRRKVSDLAVGNVLGANVANLTLVIGAAASIHEVEMTRTTQLFNFPALLAGMSLVVVVLGTGRRITRLEGVSLLGYYAVYLVLLVLTVVLL